MASSIDEESWKSFMARTDQAVRVIKGLSSDDSKTVEFSLKKAEEILGPMKENTEITDELSYVKENRTVINYKALQDNRDNQQNMSAEVFMKQVEVDATMRAEKRRHNKITRDRHLKEGNKAFREKDYEKALCCYNKALDALRDTTLPYLNRALTLLKLGLCKRAMEDIDKVLLLNPSSLKGLMYKAEAHYRLGQYEDSEKTIQEACETHPDKIKLIKDLEYKMTNPEMTEEPNL